MKIKKLFSIICIVLVLCSIPLTAIAGYKYGSSYTDSVSTTSAQTLSSHTFNRIDIGATNINITTNASNAQYYHLSLYTRNSLGVYTQYGSNAACCTSGTGGYYYWTGANPTGKTNQWARIKVVKETSGSNTISGTLTEKCRTYE